MVKAAVKSQEAKSSPASDARKQKQRKRKEKNLVRTGVVYIKHIPHGFYEDEMKGFFSQFGKVLQVCIARSPKTGNSKGFGYVQFMEEDVAKIAAETMNNYLMFEKILKCKVLPEEQVTTSTFSNAHRRPGLHCPGQKRADRAVELLSVRKGSAQKKNAQKRREAAQRRTMLRLAQLGIKYDLAGGLVEEIEPVPVPAAADTSVDMVTAEVSQQAVLEVDESDDEVTFKTPPNVIKRRLSRPAASTPQSTATTPTAPVTPAKSKAVTPAAKPSLKTATPRSTGKTTARSPKTPRTPKTPKSVSKKSPAKSLTKKSPAKSATKKSPAKSAKKQHSAGKKTPPKSGRKR